MLSRAALVEVLQAEGPRGACPRKWRGCMKRYGLILLVAVAFANLSLACDSVRKAT
jgi:hypothetical protein